MGAKASSPVLINSLPWILGVCLAMLLCHFAWAYPVGSFILKDQIAKADRIDILKVGKVEKGAVADTWVAHCRPLLTLKGDPAQTVDIAISGWEFQIFTDQTFVIFLTKNTDGTYSLVDKTNSKLTLAKFDPAKDVKDDTIQQRIAHQYENQLTSDKPDDVMRALDILEMIEAPIPKETLQKLRQSTVPAVVETALGVQVKLKDPEAVRAAFDLITSPEASAEPKRGDPNRQRLEMLAWQLERYAPDLLSVADLNRMVLVKNDPISSAGVTLLRQKGDASSIGPLMDALQHRGKEVRYDALVALSLITKRPCADNATFRADPEKEIARWVAWWANAKDTDPK